MDDLTGRIYGRLKVIAFSHKAGRVKHWICKCECGNIKTINGYNLGKGTNSCGCLAGKNIKHGETKFDTFSKEYRAWVSIKRRCFYKPAVDYKYYGGRGISVAPEWVKSYESFLKHIGRAPSTEHSIDRINVNGNYEPGNVRWATRKEQAKNKRIKS